VNIDLIATSTIRVTCVVDGNQVHEAVRALHTSFGLADDELSGDAAPAQGDGE
jgi:aspartate kinase